MGRYAKDGTDDYADERVVLAASSRTRRTVMNGSTLNDEPFTNNDELLGSCNRFLRRRDVHDEINAYKV